MVFAKYKVAVSILLSTTLLACGGGSGSDASSVSDNELSNALPVVSAGQDTIVLPTDLVELRGEANDADGDALSYEWTLMSKPEGSSASLDDATSINTHFVADVKGEYVAQLVAYDGKDKSLADSVKIIANTIPIASIEAELLVSVNSEVTLDASSSYDGDGDVLTYSWSIASAPENSSASLERPDSSVSLLVPDMAGAYQIQLLVSDGITSSEPVIANIDVQPPLTQHCVATEQELTAALSVAATNQQNDHIKLVSGRYLGNFKLLHLEEHKTEGDIVIEGGYNSSCSIVTDNKTLTVIDGNNTDAGMVIFYDITQSSELALSDYAVTVRNMTFTQGNNATTGGGGLGIMSNASILVDSVAFHDNKVTADATKSDLAGGGGLAINTLGRIKVVASEFTNNYVKEGTWGNEYGGGLALSGFQGVELSQSIITGNKAAFVSGAGIGTRARLEHGLGEVIIANNIIQNNIATNGGNGNSALYFSAISQANIFGNLIADNVSYNYTRGSAGIGNAGIYTTANHWSEETALYFIENNTIVNNVTYFDSNNRHYTNGMAVEITWMVDDFNLTLQNNIFSGNVRKDRNTGEEWQQNIALENDADDNFVSSNIVWQHNSYPLGTVITEIAIDMVGDIDFLSNYLDADYKLLPSTPLIDSGVSTTYDTAIDAQGNVRLVGFAIDFGAFEYQN